MSIFGAEGPTWLRIVLYLIKRHTCQQERVRTLHVWTMTGRRRESAHYDGVEKGMPGVCVKKTQSKGNTTR